MLITPNPIVYRRRFCRHRRQIAIGKDPAATMKIFAETVGRSAGSRF
jgi:hypothetical protein